jgi:hypothetical protein
MLDTAVEQKVLVTRMADEETEDGRVRNKEAMATIRGHNS